MKIKKANPKKIFIAGISQFKGTLEAELKSRDTIDIKSWDKKQCLKLMRFIESKLPEFYNDEN